MPGIQKSIVVFKTHINKFLIFRKNDLLNYFFKKHYSLLCTVKFYLQQLVEKRASILDSQLD